MPTLAEIMAKREAAAGKPAAAKPAGIRITPESEQAALAANIKRTLDATAPKPPPQLPRSTDRELGAMTAGERLPMDHPTPDAPADEKAWFASLHSFSCEMVLVMEPESDHGWLAIQSHPTKQPILLMRLPLANRQGAGQPF
jgi:hypothetical protein